MNLEFVTGAAGTGKTYMMRKKVREQPSYGVLASTTGISAMNLGTKTVNSLLKYFDTTGLENLRKSGALGRTLRNLADGEKLGKNLIIDEVSMMHARQLDIIVDEMEKVFFGRRGVIVTGDFCQLPPVKGEFAFLAKCWPRFVVTRLTKMQRQDEPKFLEALTALRRGDKAAAQMLAEAGVHFGRNNPDFPGITIVPTNNEAAGINNQHLNKINATPTFYPTTRKGVQLGEWKELIPELVTMKPGARVMITANDPAGFFANGDLGEFVREVGGVPSVRLDRTGQEMAIFNVTRKNMDYSNSVYGTEIGQITFMPIKLAWAVTIHKSQGLTLPMAQLHVEHPHSETPALIYVACSRVTKASNLHVVGKVEDLARRINASAGVEQWI